MILRQSLAIVVVSHFCVTAVLRHATIFLRGIGWWKAGG
jgi:hypothetical protein